MRIGILCIITEFWFTILWTFRWNVPPQLNLSEIVLVEVKVNNYFSFILDPFFHIWAWWQQVNARHTKRPLILNIAAMPNRRDL